MKPSVVFLAGLALCWGGALFAGEGHQHSSGGEMVKAQAMAQEAVSYQQALKETIQILSGMNHFPSDEQKARLDVMIAAMDSSVNGVALAETMGVLKRVQHSPSADDKARLQSLIAQVKDAQGDARLIDLMQILSNLSHKVSDADAQRLQQMSAEL